ncbi:MAG: hypothetical protein ACRCZF_06435 [Gemmataceae bacterium]
MATNIHCEHCGQHWTMATAVSHYEQEAIETRPCPACHSYTLKCEAILPRLKRNLFQWPRLARRAVPTTPQVMASNL